MILKNSLVSLFLLMLSGLVVLTGCLDEPIDQNPDEPVAGSGGERTGGTSGREDQIHAGHSTSSGGSELGGNPSEGGNSGGQDERGGMGGDMNGAPMAGSPMAGVESSAGHEAIGGALSLGGRNGNEQDAGGLDHPQIPVGGELCEGEECGPHCPNGNCEPPPCMNDADCLDVEVCLEGICRCPEDDPGCHDPCPDGDCGPPPCDNDDDCWDMEVCLDGICRCPEDDPGCHDPCPDGDCGCPPGEDCGPGPMPCAPDDSCPDPLVCGDTGFCEHPPMACFEDTDCFQPMVCDPVKEECVCPQDQPDCMNPDPCPDGDCGPPPCDNDDDCWDMEVCLDGICQCPEDNPDCHDPCPDGDCGCPPGENCEPDPILCAPDGSCPDPLVCGETGLCEPPAIECEADSDCPDGLVCGADGICECPEIHPACQQGGGEVDPDICVADSDCPDGLHCDQERAVCACPEIPPQCFGQEEPPPMVCVENADCMQPMVCDPVKEECVCPQDQPDCMNPDPCPDGDCGPPPCSNDDDCWDMEVCLDGICQCPEDNPDCHNPCPNGDCGCPPGENCEPGPILCAPDGSCPDPLVCGETGLCEPPAIECEADSDCPDGLVCGADNVCECPQDQPDCMNPDPCPDGDCGPPPCENDTDCFDAEICRDGVCQCPDDNPDCHDPCPDGDCGCPPGEDCGPGPMPCLDDGGCPEPLVCGDTGFCEHPEIQCAADSDCPDGLVCGADNICKCPDDQPNCMDPDPCPDGNCEPPIDCMQNPDDPRCQNGAGGNANGGGVDCEGDAQNYSIANALDLRVGFEGSIDGGELPEFEVGNQLFTMGGTCDGADDWYKIYLRKGEAFQTTLTFVDTGRYANLYEGPFDATQITDLSVIETSFVNQQNDTNEFVVTRTGWHFIQVVGNDFTLTLEKSGQYDFTCIHDNLKVAADPVGMDNPHGINAGERACLAVGPEGDEETLQLVECDANGELEVVQDCHDVPEGSSPTCAPDGFLGNRLGCTVNGSFDCDAYALEPGETRCLDNWLLECHDNGGRIFMGQSAELGAYEALDLNNNTKSQVDLNAHLIYNPRNFILNGEPGSDEDAYVAQKNCSDTEDTGFVEARVCGENLLEGRHRCLGPWSGPDGGEQGIAAVPPLDSPTVFPSTGTLVSCYEPLDDGGLPWAALDTAGTIYAPADIYRAIPIVQELHDKNAAALAYYTYLDIEHSTPGYSPSLELGDIPYWGNPVYLNEVYARHGIDELYDPDCPEYQLALDQYVSELGLSDEARDNFLKLEDDGVCDHANDAKFVPILGVEPGDPSYWSACRVAMRDVLKFSTKLSILAGLDGATYDVASWHVDCFANDSLNVFYDYLNSLDQATKDIIDQELAEASALEFRQYREDGRVYSLETLTARDFPNLLIDAALEGEDEASREEILSTLNKNPAEGADHLPLMWRHWTKFTIASQREYAQELRDEIDRFSEYDPEDPESQRFSIAFNRYTNGVAYLFDDIADYALSETFLGNGDPHTNANPGEGIAYPLTTLEIVHSAFRNQPTSRRFWSWNWPSLYDMNSASFGDARHELFVAEVMAYGGILQTTYCRRGFYCGVDDDGNLSDDEYGCYDWLDYNLRHKFTPVYEFLRSHLDWFERDRPQGEIAFYWSLPSTEVASLKTVNPEIVNPNHNIVLITDRMLRKMGFVVDTLVSGSADWVVPQVVSLERLQNYSVVVVGGGYAMGDDQVDILHSYVSQGGKLVVIDDIAQVNEFHEAAESAERTALRTPGQLGLGQIIWDQNEDDDELWLRDGIPLVEADPENPTDRDAQYPDPFPRRNALQLSWQLQPGLREDVTRWFRELFENNNIIPESRHGDTWLGHRVTYDGNTYEGEVHITRQSNDPSNDALIHLLNYSMIGEEGVQIFAENAGVCEEQPASWATSIPVRSGTFKIELPANLAQNGGKAQLARYGVEQGLEFDFPPADHLYIKLNPPHVILTTDNPNAIACGQGNSVCADLGEGLKTWWMIKLE